jgi:hypothetical protein
MIKTKKVNKIQQKKYEIIPYVDYITDGRMIIAAQILAYAGYTKENGAGQGAITKAAREAKVNRTTIYNWLQREDFQTAIKESRYELCASAVRNLHKLSATSPQAAIFLAQTLAPETYSLQYKKHLYNMEMLRLKAELGLSLNDDDLNPPSITIVAQTIESKDYDRNKLE